MLKQKKYRLPFQLFLLLCLNLLLTPVVLAAVGQGISKGQAYWLVALGLMTFVLSCYLFLVIFQPEKF